jgi:hypothetical protein
MSRKHTMVTGLLGPVTQTRIPAQVEGVRQMAGPLIPADCPHCHADGLMWVRGPDMGWCRTCGQCWERTEHVIAAPSARHGGNPHPVPLGPR